MSNVATLPIEADRYGACVRQIYIRGMDLTGMPMRAQVRLIGDTPGLPLVDLQTVTNGNAEGLRLVSVDIVDSVPVSHVELVINETTMKALPYAGELGAATSLAWDWQMTLAGRKQRIAKGDFVITGDGVTGADNAPANRPQAWSRSFSPTTGMRTGATLTFGPETIGIAIDGADLIGPLVEDAQDARDQALAAANLSDQHAADSALAAGVVGGFVGGIMYATTADGLAAVAEGAFFSVAGDDTRSYAVLYRKVGGAAVEISKVPSLKGLKEHYVTPEMFGAGPTYSALVDDRPAIQAAQDASELLGVKLLFLRARYALWNTDRVSGRAESGAPGEHARDGHWVTFGVGGLNWDSALGRTTLSLFGRNGSDPETDTQTVEGPTWRNGSFDQSTTTHQWRGNGLRCVAPYNELRYVASVSARNITIDGQASNCKNTPTADAWDITHKGFFLADTLWSRLHFEGVEITNFHGELTFFGGINTKAEASFLNCHFHGTTANAFNPGGLYRIAVTNCRFGDAYQAVEWVAGPGAQIVGMNIYDSHAAYITGGPMPDYGGYYGYARRAIDTYPPWVDLAGVTVDNVTKFSIGNWLRGPIDGTDSIFTLADTGRPECIQLDLRLMLDRMEPPAGEPFVPLQIYGPSGLTEPAYANAPAGIYREPPRNSRIRVKACRSDYARAGDRMWQAPVVFGGLIDSTFEVEVDGLTRGHPIAANTSVSLGAMPRIIDRGLQVAPKPGFGDGFNAPWFTATNTADVNAVQLSGPTMTLFTTGSGTYPLQAKRAFPAVGDYTPTYADRQEVTLIHGGGPGVFTLAKSGQGFFLRSDRTLAGILQSIRLVFNRQRFLAGIDPWVEVDFFGPQTG